MHSESRVETQFWRYDTNRLVRISASPNSANEGTCSESPGQYREDQYSEQVMIRITICVVGLLGIASAIAEPTEFQLTTKDNVTVYGDIYRADNSKSAPVILLFHQGGGDARGEYSDIAPRLTEIGFNAIAIDQRSGGDRFGQENRTVTGLGDKEFGYCDAYNDLEATLAYAKGSGFDGPVIVWGSSYSAALIFKLAVEHEQEIDVALAFSAAAGAPLADCQLQPYISDVNIPLLALRPQSEFEIESVQLQMAEFEAQGLQTYVADPGVHGSSMLNAARVGAPTDATWSVVLKFLNENVVGD
jgi:alpha-beta hydrolase superfamily lysophospholipase